MHWDQYQYRHEQPAGNGIDLHVLACNSGFDAPQLHVGLRIFFLDYRKRAVTVGTENQLAFGIEGVPSVLCPMGRVATTAPVSVLTTVSTAFRQEENSRCAVRSIASPCGDVQPGIGQRASTLFVAEEDAASILSLVHRRLKKRRRF